MLLVNYDLKVKTINMDFYNDEVFLKQLVNNNKIVKYFIVNDFISILIKLKLYNKVLNNDVYICYPPFNDRLKNELFILHINENLYNIGANVYNTIYFFFSDTTKIVLEIKKIVVENKEMLDIVFFNKKKNDINWSLLFYDKITIDFISSYNLVNYFIKKNIKIALIFNNFIINELSEIYYINLNIFIKIYYYKYFLN
jgi:hypothetical protein